MRNLGKQLNQEKPGQTTSGEPQVGAVGEHNSGQMSAEASDQTGTTPVVTQDKDSERRGVSQDDIRSRKVDPEAVQESFKEAELDPTTEKKPEEGERAA